MATSEHSDEILPECGDQHEGLTCTHLPDHDGPHQAIRWGRGLTKSRLVSWSVDELPCTNIHADPASNAPSD